MKLLIGIPCLFNAEATRQCIESVVYKDVSVILMDNGAEQSVKNVLSQYADMPNVVLISNTENIYVNPAWNVFIEKFLSTDNYTHLLILNSDLVLQNDWYEVVTERIKKHAHELTLPVIESILPDKVSSEYTTGNTVTSGTAGVFILLSRACATLVNPIPENYKIWFGDLFIFSVLRECGFNTTIAPNLFANHYHGGSQSVHRTPDISNIIEQDKDQWEITGASDISKIVCKFNE